ncbi:MAG TPA: MlaD family protein [Gemmatimonadales bacterium]|nr:MlaD family protein [Gemmatimonadales bacterium]
MHSYHKEATVGLLVILGVAGFILGAMWLKGSAIGNPPHVTIAYTDVQTLKEGSPVRVSGAVIGRVESIRLDRPGRVLVEITYDKDLVAPTTDATAALVGVGLLGDMAIDLDPGNGAPLGPDQVIEGTTASGLMDIGSKLADQASVTLASINRMLDTAMVSDLRATLASTQRLMAYLADARNGPTAEVGATMRQLQATAARLDSTMAAIDAATLTARVDTTLRQAGDASARLASLTARMDTLLGRVARGEGSLGKLMADTTLYAELTRTLNATSALIDSLATHPEKVGITVKIF